MTTQATHPAPGSLTLTRPQAETVLCALGVDDCTTLSDARCEDEAFACAETEEWTDDVIMRIASLDRYDPFFKVTVADLVRDRYEGGF